MLDFIKAYYVVTEIVTPSKLTLLSSFLPSTGGQDSDKRHFDLTVRQRGRIL